MGRNRPPAPVPAKAKPPSRDLPDTPRFHHLKVFGRSRIACGVRDRVECLEAGRYSASMKPKTPDAYFDSLDGPVAEIAIALRARVKARASHLTEALAWGFPCFTGNERVFSIIAQKAHANLQLWNGNRLTHVTPRVEGTGQQLRHVKLKALSDLDETVDAVIEAAVALDRDDPERVR